MNKIDEIKSVIGDGYNKRYICRDLNMRFLDRYNMR